MIRQDIMEQNFFEHEQNLEANQDTSLEHKLKPVSSSERERDCFDCNICLDSAHHPVVTLCGHLFCWPCIYKWVNVSTSTPDAQPNCPVCKASVSLMSLVPLYGHGTSSSKSESKKSLYDIDIPQRPPPPALITTASSQMQTNIPNAQPPLFHHQGYTTMAPGSTMMTSLFIPMIGLFGEMMFARISGLPAVNMAAYQNPSSNPLGYSNTRGRRQVMQVEKSLNRVTVFLLCCIVLCLLLF